MKARGGKGGRNGIGEAEVACDRFALEPKHNMIRLIENKQKRAGRRNKRVEREGGEGGLYLLPDDMKV